MAVKKNWINSIALLLKHKASVKGFPSRNQSPLLNAVLYGHSKLVEWLLIFGEILHFLQLLLILIGHRIFLNAIMLMMILIQVTPYTLAQAFTVDTQITPNAHSIYELIKTDPDYWKNPDLKQKVKPIINTCGDAIRQFNLTALAQVLERECPLVDSAKQIFLDNHFFIAAQMKNSEAMHLLIEYGARPGNTFNKIASQLKTKPLADCLNHHDIKRPQY